MKENNNIELENFQTKDIDSIIQENRPMTIPSSTAEIQNIFKKIRKRNKEIEIKKGSVEFGNDESKQVSNSLLNNDQNKSSLTQNINPMTYIIIFVNIFSFVIFQYYFIPFRSHFLFFLWI